MSYYLATFGPEPDVASIRDIAVARGSAVSAVGAATMLELARGYNLGNGHFVVDETGDTAHELLEEAWPPGATGAVLYGTRLHKLLARAEPTAAAVAIWDATWNPSTDGPPDVLEGYDDFRSHLLRCASLWDIDGVLCLPHRRSERIGKGHVA